MSDSLRDALAARPYPMVPLRFTRRSVEDSLQRARDFHDTMQQRRTTRHFSSDPVPRAAHRDGRSAPPAARRAARTSSRGRSWRCPTPRPSGGFARRRRRRSRPSTAAGRRRSGSTRWPRSAPTSTSRTSPTRRGWWCCSARPTASDADGTKRTYYYTPESCGIAAGFFIAAVHVMGLVTLTHTPEPDGLPRRAARTSGQREGDAGDAGRLSRRRTLEVPDIERKPLDEVAVWR